MASSLQLLLHRPSSLLEHSVSLKNNKNLNLYHYGDYYYRHSYLFGLGQAGREEREEGEEVEAQEETGLLGFILQQPGKVLQKARQILEWRRLVQGLLQMIG